MDWTEGYASDVEYTAGFYREQAPALLNFACLINGVEPVDLSRPFTYCELGFGRGVTANVLAAANPLGRFYAADFNPAHVAGARQVAGQAGLDNLVLLENSFEELANGEVELPQFDFVTLHGIYTWVTAENRAHIGAFLARYVKPGGVVYLSYNAMPGWAPLLPLQRLIIEHAQRHPGRSDHQIQGAREFIGQLGALRTGYLTSPALENRLDMLRTQDPHYLVHEYMHKHWQPMYFADVAGELAGAKLDYVGSAELSDPWPGLFLSPDKLALLAQIEDPLFLQTVRDYMMNISFRKDVFVRGARRMAPLRLAEAFGEVGVALTREAELSSNVMQLAHGEVTGKPELYLPFLAALADGPTTLAQLRETPALAGADLPSLAQVAALLTASGQAAVYFPAAVQHDGGAAVKMNRALAAHTRFGDEYQVLASHLLGTGVATTFLERMVFNSLSEGLAEHDMPALARAARATLLAQGRTVLRDGQPLSDPEEILQEVSAKVADILALRLPLWRRLKMI